jgi:hypothetical protein
LQNDISALQTRVTALENAGGGGATGWYGTIYFSFNLDGAESFTLNVPGIASNVAINQSQNSWTLPIQNRLATSGTSLGFDIFPNDYYYLIADAGFKNESIQKTPSGWLIPSTLYNTTVEYGIDTYQSFGG